MQLHDERGNAWWTQPASACRLVAGGYAGGRAGVSVHRRAAEKRRCSYPLDPPARFFPLAPRPATSPPAEKILKHRVPLVVRETVRDAGKGINT